MGFNKLYGQCMRMKARGEDPDAIKKYHALSAKSIRLVMTRMAFRFKRKEDIEVIK